MQYPESFFVFTKKENKLEVQSISRDTSTAIEIVLSFIFLWIYRVAVESLKR